ncbi:hypothetical protein [Trinickia mobilis]|nr:hypothetical protein [Trinickia mobilis]
MTRELRNCPSIEGGFALKAMISTGCASIVVAALMAAASLMTRSSR